MTINEVKPGSFVQLEDYNGRYQVKVTEVTPAGGIRGQFRVIAVLYSRNPSATFEDWDSGTDFSARLGLFEQPKNIIQL